MIVKTFKQKVLAIRVRKEDKPVTILGWAAEVANEADNQIAQLEKILVDVVDWDQLNPEQASYIRGLHQKYYPENYVEGGRNPQFEQVK